MTTECYFGKCPHHSNNSGNPHDEGPFCDQPKCLATPAQNAVWAEERKNQLSMLTMTPNAPVDFDAWMANPYTAVLFKSIAEDYVPKHDNPQQAGLKAALDSEAVYRQLSEDAKPFAERTVKLVKALRTIAEWELPEVVGPNGGPSTFNLEYGSNGARDYMRIIAQKAINWTPSTDASPTPKWAIRPDGDANFYTIMDAENHWLMRVQHNGESMPLAQIVNVQKMIDLLQDKPPLITVSVEEQAQSLIDNATASGLCVGISRKPLKPLAMGHAEYVVETYPVRGKN